MAQAAPPTTTAAPRAAADAEGVGPLSKRYRFGWVLEVLGMLGVALFHDELRNWVMGTRAESLRNAKSLTSVEKWLGIYHEQAIQHFFLHSEPLIVFFNVYYSTMHFLVPMAAAIFLYVKFPVRYVRWRNTFLVMLLFTGALGWGLFPITPPKYMPASYGFVDTQTKYENFAPQEPLSYGPDGEPSAKVIDSDGNLYSGMPSHHISWALVALLALWPVVRRWWVRALIALHFVITSVAVLTTANHRFLDFVGSFLEVALAYCVAVAIERLLARRRAARAGLPPEGEAVLVGA
jgi:hypothetical protein